MPIIKHDEKFLFILFEDGGEGSTSTYLTLCSPCSGISHDTFSRKLFASVTKQSKAKTTGISTKDFAFHKSASYRFSSKVGKPGHRDNIVESLKKTFPTTNTLVDDLSKEIRKDSSKYSEKRTVFVPNNTQSVSLACVNVGKCC